MEYETYCRACGPYLIKGLVRVGNLFIILVRASDSKTKYFFYAVTILYFSIYAKTPNYVTQTHTQ